MMRSSKLTPAQWGTVDAFHRLYYESRMPGTPTWLGYYILKHPFDMVTYQELLTYYRPDWLVETGTAWGGSAYFYATIFDLLGHGQVCSVDWITDVPGLYRWAFGQDFEVPTATRPVHPRILYLTGDTKDPVTAQQVARIVRGRVMVTLDSNHSAAHVMQELALFAPLVTPGSCLIVEDTNMGGHPVQEPPWEGPWEATQAFLLTHPEFEIDHHLTERHLMSYNIWLVRKEECTTI